MQQFGVFLDGGLAGPPGQHVPRVGWGHRRCHWVKTGVLISQFPDSDLEHLSHHGHLGQLRNNPALSFTVNPESKDSAPVSMSTSWDAKLSRSFCPQLGWLV